MLCLRMLSASGSSVAITYSLCLGCSFNIININGYRQEQRFLRSEGTFCGAQTTSRLSRNIISQQSLEDNKKISLVDTVWQILRTLKYNRGWQAMATAYSRTGNFIFPIEKKILPEGTRADAITELVPINTFPYTYPR